MTEEVLEIDDHEGYPFEHVVSVNTIDLKELFELAQEMEDRSPREQMALNRIGVLLHETLPFWRNWLEELAKHVGDSQTVVPIEDAEGVRFDEWRICAGCDLPIGQQEYETMSSHEITAAISLSLGLEDHEHGLFHDECCPAPGCRAEHELWRLDEIRRSHGVGE